MVKNIIVLLLLVLILLARYNWAKPQFADGQRIKITTTVLTQPIIYDQRQYIKLLRLKIYLPLYPEVSYGDKVQIVGVVDGDKLKNPQLSTWLPSKNIIFKFRQKLLEVYKRALPIDEAALVSGVVLGSKTLITNSFWEQLKNSGTAHVVVASGMNVTLLAGFLISTFVLFVRRRVAIVFVFVGIWTYALICGLDAPIVRAAIMTSIALAGQETGRVNYTLRSLFITAYIMLMVNPNWLTDIGFQLSFLATFSLMTFSRRIEKAVDRIKFMQKIPKFLVESFSTTISAQIGVVPLLFITFGRYNPVSIIANTFTLWVIPILTVSGFFAGVVGLFYQPAGRSLLYIIYPLAKYFTYVVEMFGV